MAATVVSPSLVAAFLVLLPGMALLWFHLRRYEGYFEQGRLFFGLIVGLFAGILVRFLEVAAFPFDIPRLLQPGTDPLTTGTLLYSFAYTAFGFGLVESLGKTAILGFKKFRTRKDTPYYGVSVGLGFGAMWTMQLVAGRLWQDDAGGVATHQVALMYAGFLLMLAIGLMLAHAASGVWVARGSAEGKLWRGLMHGTLWLAPALAFYWLFFNYGYPGLVGFVCLAYGVMAMWVADRKVLLEIVPPEIRDMVRRERRREARKQGRE